MPKSTSNIERVYGWKPSRPSIKDFIYSAAAPAPLQDVELIGHKNIPPIVDQLQLGACTANAGAFVFEFDLMNKPGAPADPSAALFPPSRLYTYYWTRFEEGTTSSDAGATVKDTIQCMVKYGVCEESLWAYDVTKFAIEPPAICTAQAKKFEAVTYQSVKNTVKSNIVNALLEGFPVIHGFTVYESFESDAVANTGIVPMPGRNEQELGGHCAAIVGYELANDLFLCRNSWGTSWGINGYYKIPGAYLTNSSLASDFWIVSNITYPH